MSNKHTVVCKQLFSYKDYSVLEGLCAMVVTVNSLRFSIDSCLELSKLSHAFEKSRDII